MGYYRAQDLRDVFVGSLGLVWENGVDAEEATRADRSRGRGE